MSSKPWCYIKVNPRFQAKIDMEDKNRVSRHTWRVVTKESGRQKVVTNIIDKNGRNQQISLGKFLMHPPKGKMVYPRRFQDGFDYRKSNLIVCTMQERQRILPPSRKHGSSKFKGVSYISSRKKWRAALKHKGQSITIGMYSNQDTAALAYNKKAREIFGPDCYQNQVDMSKVRRSVDKKK